MDLVEERHVAFVRRSSTGRPEKADRARRLWEGSVFARLSGVDFITVSRM
jgi:hypothetical protein